MQHSDVYVCPTAMLEQDELRRRMRAARALAGYKHVRDLAAVIPKDAQLGERKLRALEGGEDVLRPPALREIAAACGLPYEFFTADIAVALTPSQSRMDRLETEMRGISLRLDGVVAALQREAEEEADRAVQELSLDETDADTGTAASESSEDENANPTRRAAP